MHKSCDCMASIFHSTRTHTHTPGMPEPKQQKKLGVKAKPTFKSARATAAVGSVCTAMGAAAKQTPGTEADIELEFPPRDFLARFQAAFARGFRPSVMVEDKNGRFSRAMPPDTWRAMRRQGFA